MCFISEWWRSDCSVYAYIHIYEKSLCKGGGLSIFCATILLSQHVLSELGSLIIRTYRALALLCSEVRQSKVKQQLFLGLPFIFYFVFSVAFS